VREPGKLPSRFVKYHNRGRLGQGGAFIVGKFTQAKGTQTMFELTIVPAYGRTYNSKAAIWSDWLAGKDFQIASVGADTGRYINREDAERSGLACLLVRYGKALAKSASINLIRGRMN
jgi:hypothetical protein